MNENSKIVNKAVVSKKDCVACGSCTKVCPKSAITIENGSYAKVNPDLCIGCRACQKTCPALAISMQGEMTVKKTKHWYEYLWIFSLTYLILGMFNILFAWIGLLCFLIPLIISIIAGSKLYCNTFCGRGQLFNLVGSKLSFKQDTPRFLKSKWFRYGFLIFFLIMFISMITTTVLVFSEITSLKQVVTLFWTFKVPWSFAYHSGASDWAVQFAYGFYSLMLTSSLIGFIAMILFRPRTWCVFCPMGTMTHLICKIKNSGKECDTMGDEEDEISEEEETSENEMKFQKLYDEDDNW